LIHGLILASNAGASAAMRAKAKANYTNMCRAMPTKRLFDKNVL
jgi:hypothetical protein